MANCAGTGTWVCAVHHSDFVSGRPAACMWYIHLTAPRARGAVQVLRVLGTRPAKLLLVEGCSRRRFLGISTIPYMTLPACQGALPLAAVHTLLQTNTGCDNAMVRGDECLTPVACAARQQLRRPKAYRACADGGATGWVHTGCLHIPYCCLSGHLSVCRPPLAQCPALEFISCKKAAVPICSMRTPGHALWCVSSHACTLNCCSTCAVSCTPARPGPGHVPQEGPLCLSHCVLCAGLRTKLLLSTLCMQLAPACLQLPSPHARWYEATRAAVWCLL